MRILFVEDDHVLGQAIRDHIEASGHSVDWMKRLDEARLAIDTTPYELIVLDLGLPDGRGLDLLDQVRRSGNSVPVIIATAQDQLELRIEGLNAGADDYLVKPFDLNELTARLNAVARRYAVSPMPDISIDNISIDIGRRTILRDNTQVKLTAREWAVVERLARNHGSIISKSEIEDSLYEFGAEIESNAVEVYVSRLRKKLGPNLIKTVRGLGYQIEA